MGGEGSMMAAIASLKANRALRKKRKIGELSLVSSKNEKWVDHKTASFKQLMEIRKRVRKEQKVQRIKTYFFTLLGLVIVLSIILYILSLPF